MLELVAAAALAATPLETVGFSQAVERALAQHLALVLAGEDVARADAVTAQVRAGSLPTLGVNGTYTRLDADRVLSGRVIAGRDQVSGNVTLSVPLATARWAQWWRASRAADVSRTQVEDVRRQVAVAAARAWLAVLGQKRVLEAATRARDTAQAHLDYARERRRGGVGTRIDELRSDQELQNSAVQVAQASGQLARLQETLGLAVGADAPVDCSAEEPRLASPDTPEASQKSAESERKDVKAARARDEVAQANTRDDWADYVPLVSLVAQPFLQDPPSLVQPLTGWQAQVVLTLPLYEGGLRYGQARERRALARSAHAQLDLALKQARSDVRLAFEVMQRADEALRAAKDSARDAAEALELAVVAWKSGATTNLEVTDAERRSRDAATQAAQAEDAARQARLDVLAASGRFP
jgi:outer membrane protein TolC